MNLCYNSSKTQFSDWIERFLLHPTHRKFSTSPNPIFQAAGSSLYYVQRLTVDHKPDGYRDLRRILMSNAYVAPFTESRMKEGDLYTVRVPQVSDIGWDAESKEYRYTQIEKMMNAINDAQQSGTKVANRADSKAVDKLSATMGAYAVLQQSSDRPLAYKAAIGDSGSSSSSSSSSAAAASGTGGRSNIYDNMKSATDLPKTFNFSSNTRNVIGQQRKNVMRFWARRRTLWNPSGISGGLMVCRGLGDLDAQTFGHSIEPDVFDFSGEDLSYLVIASDGIWDGIDVETDVQYLGHTKPN